jgi:hypothetical protein
MNILIFLLAFVPYHLYNSFIPAALIPKILYSHLIKFAIPPFHFQSPRGPNIVSFSSPPMRSFVFSPRDPRMESVDEAGGKDPVQDQILMLLLISGE